MKGRCLLKSWLFFDKLNKDKYFNEENNILEIMGISQTCYCY